MFRKKLFDVPIWKSIDKYEYKQKSSTSSKREEFSIASFPDFCFGWSLQSLISPQHRYILQIWIPSFSSFLLLFSLNETYIPLFQCFRILFFSVSFFCLVLSPLSVFSLPFSSVFLCLFFLHLSLSLSVFYFFPCLFSTIFLFLLTSPFLLSFSFPFVSLTSFILYIFSSYLALILNLSYSNFSHLFIFSIHFCCLFPLPLVAFFSKCELDSFFTF